MMEEHGVDFLAERTTMHEVVCLCGKHFFNYFEWKPSSCFQKMMGIDNETLSDIENNGLEA